MAWPYSETYNTSGPQEITEECGYYTSASDYEEVVSAYAYVDNSLSNYIKNISTIVYGTHNTWVSLTFNVQENHSDLNINGKLYMDVIVRTHDGYERTDTYECDIYITPYFFYQEASGGTVGYEWTPWEFRIRSSFEPNIYAYSLSVNSGATSWMRFGDAVTKSSYLGEWLSRVIIYVEENSGNTARSTVVTAEYNDGTYSGEFNWYFTQLENGEEPIEDGEINIITSPVTVNAYPHSGLTCEFELVDMIATSITITTSYNWIHPTPNPTHVSGNVYSAVYEVSQHQLYSPREGTLWIAGTDVNGSPVNVQYYITQLAAVRTESFWPVWKQLKYSMHPITEEYIDYTLDVSDGSSYKLRSYTNDYVSSIEINDIAADHVYDSLSLNQTDTGHGNFVKSDTAIKKFSLYKDLENVHTLCGEYMVTNDWSYIDYPLSENEVYLSDPISYVLDSRQLFLFTLYGRFADSSAKVWFNDTLDNSAITFGHYTFVQNLDKAQWPGDFEPQSFNNDFLHYFYGSVHNDTNMILNFNNIYRFNVINSCKQYCLYYLNARGGWDTLLVDGKAIRSDKYTNSTYSKNYSNLNKANWGVVNYRKDVNPTWQLSTGYLLDSQAEKMYNILGSTKAYLHDLNSDEIYSVIINNKNCDYKTFNNQGRKMFVYTIEVEASQKQQRGQ